MTPDDTQRLRAEVENEIETYLADCRGRATGFVSRHFSLAPVVAAHAKTARLDVLRHPINLALALPSLVLKRAADTAERLGWTRVQTVLERVPLPLKTAYERQLDAQLLTELFELPDAASPIPSPLTQAFLASPLVSAGIADGLEFLRSDDWVRVELAKITKEWSSARAQLIDAAGSGAVLAASYLVFRSSGHGVLEMGRKMAGDRARTQAVDNFVLGERVGSLFYSIAPVHPTTSQVVVATAIMFAFVGLLTVAVNLLSDPLQRQFGMQHKQILRAIDSLEERMLLALKKRLRSTGVVHTPIPSFTVERMAALSGQAMDFASIATGYARSGTVKVLANVIAGVSWVWRRYVKRVGLKRARLSMFVLLAVALAGFFIAREKMRVDPYKEAEDLVSHGAYPTALARLDWLNRHPGYKEQAYYWYLRGRAHCGMARNTDATAADACSDAYQRTLQRDISYREDEHVVDDVVMLVRDYNQPRAKKLVLQELGPGSVTALKRAVLSATDRFEMVLLIEQLGARAQLPYAEIAKLELDASEVCEDKRHVLERMLSEGWRNAVPLLKPLQDAKKWKCLQPTLKATLSRLAR